MSGWTRALTLILAAVAGYGLMEIISRTVIQ